MVFTKTIVQVYNETSLFTFEDFFRGTLRLIKFASENSMNVKLNLEGNPISQYLIIQNYPTFNFSITPYWMYKDDSLLLSELDAFRENSLPIFPVTSNVWLKRTDITPLVLQEFNKLVQIRPEIIAR